MKIRVVTYNIHKGFGGVDRRYQLSRIIDSLGEHNADILFLQEVDHGARRSRRDEQCDLIGDALGLRHRRFVRNVSARGGGGYGNAILSRFPLSRTDNIDLKIGWRKQRSALHCRARIRSDDGQFVQSLHLFNLHLGLAESERQHQLQRLLAGPTFQNFHHRTPILLAGDLNDVWGRIGNRLQDPSGFHAPPLPGHTFPAFAPLRALDGIYARGDVRLENLILPQSTIAKRASDHLPLVGDLYFPNRITLDID